MKNGTNKSSMDFVPNKNESKRISFLKMCPNWTNGCVFVHMDDISLHTSARKSSNRHQQRIVLFIIHKTCKIID